MTVQFHFLDAYDEIPVRLLLGIRRDLEDARTRVTTILPITRVDVVVAPTLPQWVIPEYGLTGSSHGRGRITVSFDPASPRLNDPQRGERVLGILAHELHHVTRMRGLGYDSSFGESLVSEGLAQCFEIEAGAPVPFYSVALDLAALKSAGERARDQLASSHYDHNSWFYGRRDDPDWPRSAGYSLAFALMKDWLARTSTSAAAAAIVPAAQVLDAWRERNFEIHHPSS